MDRARIPVTGPTKGETKMSAGEGDNVLDPPIRDSSGYGLRQRDIKFLRIETHAISGWRSRAVPLGMSPADYQLFKTQFAKALVEDNVDPDDCDVRIQGSAASVFSGPHKVLPCTRDEWIDAFRSARGDVPERWEIDAIDTRLRTEWVTDEIFPVQRPFDCMHKLGVSPDQSDVDVQISSDSIFERCVTIITDLGQAPEDARFKHPAYNFARKDLVERAVPRVFFFSCRIGDLIGRDITLAVFPSKGPPDVSNAQPVSSHFRASDWVVWSFNEWQAAEAS